MVAVVAETFGQLPTVVARDLDRDPGRLSVICVELLRYRDAKAAFDNAKDKTSLEGWEGSKLMERVTRNTFELAKERRARRSGG